MKLYVKYIGRMDFLINNVSVVALLSEKAKAILIYMLFNKKPYHRDHLKKMFWCDFSEKSANRNLRHAIWNIRSTFRSIDDQEEILINETKSIIKINDDILINSDVEEFIHFTSEKNNKEYLNDIRRYLKNYSYEFLESFYIDDAQGFNNWIYFEREKFKRLYFDSFLKWAKDFMHQGRYDVTLEILNNLILLDPYNEKLYLLMMKAHVKNGHKSYAVNIFKEAKRVLREELNLGVSQEIMNYYDQLYQNEVKPSQSNGLIKENLIQYLQSNDQIFIYQMIKREDLKRFKYDMLDLDHPRKIELAKIPGRRLAYEGVFEFLDEYKHLFSESNKLGALKVINQMKSKHIDELVLFSQIETFMDNHLEDEIFVIIYNLAYMDDKFIDLLSYLYRRNGLKNMRITMAYNMNWETNRIKFFVNALKDLDQVTIIKLSD